MLREAQDPPAHLEFLPEIVARHHRDPSRSRHRSRVGYGAHDERLRSRREGEQVAIKVRPFAETIEGTRMGTTLELRGSIGDGLFVLGLVGQEFEVRARAVGADERGPFALLDESEQRLDFGAYLRIRPEYEPEMPPGGEIEIVSEQFSRERWENAARAHGIDSTRVNLIVPPQRSVSLHVDDDGNVNGRGTLG